MNLTGERHEGFEVLEVEPGDAIPLRPSGPFAMNVTPELAAYWLTLNVGNQRTLKTQIVKFVSDMVNGRWLFTSPPIAFSDAGTLGDGNHRLNSIILADCSVWMRVEFGWPVASFDVVDSGTSRTASDVLKLHGIGDANVAAAAVTLVAKYDEVKGTSRAFMNSSQANYVPSRSDIKDRYESNELVWRRAISIGRSVQARLDRSLTATVWSAAAYICLRSDAPRAEVFFEDLLREQPKNLPAARLRTWAIRRLVKDGSTGDPRENLENILRAFRSRSDVRPSLVKRPGFRLTLV